MLDEQGLAGCFLFPTLGMIYEEPLKDDPEAVCITFRAFNRWLAEDWTFDYEGRILTAPYLTLADEHWAVEELEWALDQGARLIVMRAGAPTTVTGRRSPFDSSFDPFWARVERGRHHRGGARGGQRPVVATATRSTASRRTSGSATSGPRSRASTSRRPCTTSSCR